MKCKIKVAGDTTWCDVCRLMWDTNDAVPMCPYTIRPEQPTLIARLWYGIKQMFRA